MTAARHTDDVVRHPHVAKAAKTTPSEHQQAKRARDSDVDLLEAMLDHLHGKAAKP